jgi:hypothetical protein
MVPACPLALQQSSLLPPFFSHNVSQIVAEYLNWKRSHQHPRSDCVKFKSVVFGFGGHCGVCCLVRFALKDLVYTGRIKQKSRYIRPLSKTQRVARSYMHMHMHMHARASAHCSFMNSLPAHGLICRSSHLSLMPSQVVELVGARCAKPSDLQADMERSPIKVSH